MKSRTIHSPTLSATATAVAIDPLALHPKSRAEFIEFNAVMGEVLSMFIVCFYRIYLQSHNSGCFLRQDLLPEFKTLFFHIFISLILFLVVFYVLFITSTVAPLWWRRRRRIILQCLSPSHEPRALHCIQRT